MMSLLKSVQNPADLALLVADTSLLRLVRRQEVQDRRAEEGGGG
ncbi:hypothetical protein [Micromonospora craterilacus]|nr:hypothetical protein [Micromonospora craterilacus]